MGLGMGEVMIRNQRRFLSGVAATVFLFSLGCADVLAQIGPRIVAEEESAYSHITVVDSRGERCLLFGRDMDNRETCIDLDDPDRPIFEYTRMMFVGFLAKPDTKRLLMIGLGGGYMPNLISKHRPGVVQEVVEIDPKVAEIAEKYFGFKTGPNLILSVADGRVHVEKSTQHFDQVWLDAFSEDYVPRHLATRQFLEKVKGLLNKGGVVVANLHTRHPMFADQVATARAVFARVCIAHGDYSGNTIMFASDSPGFGKESLAAGLKEFGKSFGPVDLGKEISKVNCGDGPSRGHVLEDD